MTLLFAGREKRRIVKLKVFDIEQDFFSKLWIFSPICAEKATPEKEKQQMRHLLNAANELL
jgi:hypothetical protein